MNVHKPKILGLLEPRVSGDQADGICKRIGLENWVRVEAVGFSGGIWVFWSEELAVEILYTHPQFVLLKIGNDSEFPWFLSIVYGSPSAGLRQRLWADLSVSILNFRGAWLMAGDYNVVVSSVEVSTEGPLSHSRCSGFQDWIYDQELMDLGFVGSVFTWVRGL